MVDNDSVERAPGKGAAHTPPVPRACDQVVGRESELNAIRRFLGEVTQGPRSLVIEGEPGIRKTTLWAAGVRRSIFS
jgi:hypothetical protein